MSGPESTPPIEPFTILPSGELKRALRGDPADYTDQLWVLAAKLPLGARGLVVVDPRYWQPRVEASARAQLPTPAGTADVWLERWTGADRRPRFAAARVIVSDGVARARSHVCNVAVDSHRLLLGCRDALDARWRVGGPKNRSNVVAFGAQAEAAAIALRQAGFAVRSENGMTFFAAPLSDDEIAAGNVTLAGTGLSVNVCEPHTGAELDEVYVRGEPCLLSADGSPYAVVFDTGWGNGIYAWDRLDDAQGALLGYECSFAPD